MPLPQKDMHIMPLSAMVPLLHGIATQCKQHNMAADSISEADAGWHQPVAHWPDMRPLMSDLARCFRQPFSRALAALLAEVDGTVQPGERGQR